MSTSETTTTPGSAEALPDYAPVPRSALGPAMNEQGYYVGRVERNPYWVTDGTYQSAFLTTPEGIVLFDAPPTIGHNLRRAVDEIAAANGVTNRVSHLIYSHHHADHAGASSLFDTDVVRIGHEETRRLLLRDDDPARPAPEETFQDRRTLDIGGERIELAWHGSNHTPDNIYIHLPDHDTLMLVDFVNCGWAPVYISNLTEDIPGSIEAPANALAYPWKHYVGGHLGRLGSRDDVTLHQRYMADLSDSIQDDDRHARSDPVLREVRGEQLGSGEGLPRRLADTAAAAVIEKYKDVLAAADVFTASTAFWVMESIRLDLGYGSYVHPDHRPGAGRASGRQADRLGLGRVRVAARLGSRRYGAGCGGDRPHGTVAPGMSTKINGVDPEAREFLRNADPVLAKIIEARPDFRPRAWMDELPPLDAFGTLIFQVAGQQLSVRATRTILSRLEQRFGGGLPTAVDLLAADPQVLRDSGLSFRKGATLRALAERFVDGRLSDETLSRMTDDEVEAALTEVPGIGPWTAHGFLLVALDRPDVFLPGDLALRRAIQRAYGLDHVPTEDEMTQVAERWRPYRSLAVSYLFASEYDERP